MLHKKPSLSVILMYTLLYLLHSGLVATENVCTLLEVPLPLRAISMQANENTVLNHCSVFISRQLCRHT